MSSAYAFICKTKVHITCTSRWSFTHRTLAVITRLCAKQGFDLATPCVLKMSVAVKNLFQDYSKTKQKRSQLISYLGVLKYCCDLSSIFTPLFGRTYCKECSSASGSTVFQFKMNSGEFSRLLFFTQALRICHFALCTTSQTHRGATESELIRA